MDTCTCTWPGACASSQWWSSRQREARYTMQLQLTVKYCGTARKQWLWLYLIIMRFPKSWIILIQHCTSAEDFKAVKQIDLTVLLSPTGHGKKLSMAIWGCHLNKAYHQRGKMSALWMSAVNCQHDMLCTCRYAKVMLWNLSCPSIHKQPPARCTLWNSNECK